MLRQAQHAFDAAARFLAQPPRLLANIIREHNGVGSIQEPEVGPQVELQAMGIGLVSQLALGIPAFARRDDFREIEEKPDNASRPDS